MSIVKEEAQKIVEKLPNKATWDDLMYEIYVRQAIEAGLADSKAGRTKDVKEIRAKFGLQKDRYSHRSSAKHPRLHISYICRLRDKNS